MARNKKQTGTNAAGKKSASAAKSKAKTPAKSAGSAVEKKPIRREVGAAICAFLCVFNVLSILHVKAIFTTGLIEPLFKGLVGVTGYYILPLAFFLSFIILLFHDGRPVRLRVLCTFAMIVCIGAMAHLLSEVADLAWGLPMIGNLYKGGISGTTGGLICGFLAMLLQAIFGKAGAMILFIVLLLLSLLTSLNMTVPGIAKAIRNRPRPEYDEPEEPVDTAQTVVNYVAQRRADRAAARRTDDFDVPVSRRANEPDFPVNRRVDEFDLPVDDPPVPVKKRTARKVKSPDEFLLNEQPAAPVDGEERESEQAEQLPELPFEPDEPSVQPEPAPEPKTPRQSEPPAARQQTAAPPAPPEAIAAEIEMQPQQALYEYPPVSLLLSGKTGADGTAEMRDNKKRLDETLHCFNIDATIVNVIRGPSVTRYELELASGVKLSKLTGLADDIALALGADGVRIAAIPERISIVGIEVPNKIVSIVCLRDVIESPQFARAKSKVAFCVGKDISGNCIVGDIARLPHMLIAGTTGSGKSVCINSLLVSLLYKASPDEVKMIMVDPKMVELGMYNGIPHLLIPVVTDPKKAAGALQWGVNEMMRRYRLMAEAEVHNLAEYNRVAENSAEHDVMPQIVVVIDELADLMLAAAKEVEESICRIAQMGRAAGIHLVVATQRPSADVITGLMKANIPSRIAFAVASATESRIILDTMGAEKLVGKGDMLYSPLGQGKPRRVQGCCITDEEVRKVVSYVKQQSAPAVYNETIIAEIDCSAEQSGDKSKPSSSGKSGGFQYSDEMLPEAVEVILETGQASVSMLQRRLKLGYARAARIVDEMEDKGIVGPYEGSKPRQLLINQEQWQALQNGETLLNPSVEEEID